MSQWRKMSSHANSLFSLPLSCILVLISYRMHAVLVQGRNGAMLVVVGLQGRLGAVPALVHAAVASLVQLPLLHVGGHVLPLRAQSVPL